MKTRKKILSGARGIWLRKPETKIKQSAKLYRRKGRKSEDKKLDPEF